MVLVGVFVFGLVFICLIIFGFCEKIVNVILMELKFVVGVGIGFFIVFLGFKNVGIIVLNEFIIVVFGDLYFGLVLLVVFGIVVIVVYMIIGWKGVIFFGMVIIVVVGMLFGLIDVLI